MTPTTSKAGVYHVDIHTAEGTFTLGVCATGKTEARLFACDRMTRDGYTAPTPGRCTREGGSVGWTFGTTLLYSGHGEQVAR